jgi:hypothetical protein
MKTELERLETGPARHLNRAAAYLLAAAASYRHGGQCHVDRHLKEAEDSIVKFQAERGDK